MSELTASGRIVAAQNGSVTFKPANTRYELQLDLRGGPYAGPIDVPVRGIIRVKARKVWTVPAGGNFVAPILGTPRTIQGRVRQATERVLVIQAGTTIHVEMPASDVAVDLCSGPITVGAMVNVAAMPGASFEWVREPAPASTTPGESRGAMAPEVGRPLGGAAR